MNQLIEFQRILLDQFSKQHYFHRDVFEKIQLNNNVTGIVGSRGVGKTTYLLHTIKEHNLDEIKALYVSADHIYFLENKLLDLVEQLYKETNIRLICIDEIHKYPNWQQELKNITDFFIEFKVIFTGSSMIDIIHSKYDLSRRVSLYEIHGLSFREYLQFNNGTVFDKIFWDDIIYNHQAICHQISQDQLLFHFKNYLRKGYYPFFTKIPDEFQLLQAIENIVQKNIYEDIATLHAIKSSSLITVEKLYKFVINSQPGELSAYKLANALSKDYESISLYTKYLEQAGLIRALHKKQSGKAYLKNPIKIYPENSNLIYANYLSQPQDMLIGKVRETFAINQLQCAKLSIHYSEAGDFEVKDHTIEIGGKNKTQKQIKGNPNAYIFSDDILIGSKNKIPLYLMGFLN